MPDELKEGDEGALRGKVARIVYHQNGHTTVHVQHNKDGEITTVLLSDDEADCLSKVRPGTYEVTAREIVKMLARLFRYKRLMAEIITHEGRLNKLLQRRARLFFAARMKELRRKRGGK